VERQLEPSVHGGSMLLALRRHWPEYLMEAAELGAFMIAACVAAVVLVTSEGAGVRPVCSCTTEPFFLFPIFFRQPGLQTALTRVEPIACTRSQQLSMPREDEPPLISTTFGTTSPFAAEATE